MMPRTALQARRRIHLTINQLCYSTDELSMRDEGDCDEASVFDAFLLALHDLTSMFDCSFLCLFSNTVEMKTARLREPAQSEKAADE